MSADESRPGQGAASDVNMPADTPSLGACTDICQWAERFPNAKAAIAYARGGLPVFPLGLNKKPLRLCALCSDRSACPGGAACVCAVDTCHSFYAATTDLALVGG